MNQIQLGATYRDRITGVQGIATGHCTYISGCNQTLLQPKAEKADAKPDSHWFDDQRLERVSAGHIALDNGATPGHDVAAPKR